MTCSPLFYVTANTLTVCGAIDSREIDNDETIQENQTLATAGWSNGVVSSAYPPGIPVGRVTQADSGEQQQFQRIHVQPFADLRQLEYVQVLTGGPERPGVPG